jgi:hypothetical protein
LVRRNPTDDHDPSFHHPASSAGGPATNDPRAYRKLQRQEQARESRQRALRQEAEKRRQAAQALDLPPQPLVETIGGGPSLIFEMARKMMLWEPTDGSGSSSGGGGGAGGGTDTKVRAPPRWHPTSGISDVNPNFRTSSPVMSSQGYAGTIWRNVRKDRPSQWRYALRTYDGMPSSEEAPSPTSTGERGAGAGAVRRSNVHHEGAMLACAKLGLWRRALEIYRHVEEEQARSANATDASSPSSSNPAISAGAPSASIHAKFAGGDRQQKRTREKSHRKAVANLDQTPGRVFVTEAMLLSLIRACVRATRQMRKQRQPPGGSAGVVEGSSSAAAPDASLKRRRAPLDAAVEVLTGLVSSSPSPVDFPVVARHVNPIAAAYQSIGLNAEANFVLKALLTERTIGPEAEDGNDPFNVNDVQARDKGSYSLVVQGAVSEGDYVAAVEALSVMTEAGLYPNQRHLNAWTEISERKTKHRTTRSWTKKRDESWLESVR